MSIPEIINKIKSASETKQSRDIMSILVLLGVALGSFLLGQQSKLDNKNNIISISGVTEPTHNENNPLLTVATNTNTQNVAVYEKGNYLASSRGKKYYPVDCPAANNIKVENRVYFKTATEAENKGYALSSSCN